MISKERKISVYTLQDSRFTLSDVQKFMKIVDEDFVPRFSTYVNIQEYLAKLERYAEILLAINGNGILGVMAFYCNNVTEGLAYITYLAVQRNCRGKGIGEKLLMKCIDMAKAAGMKSMQTRTWKGNYPVIALYEKYGFRKIRECSDRADGSMSVYLELKLNSL